MVTINKELFSKMLVEASNRLIDNSTYFSEIDSRFGDGDHGVTIKKISLAIKSAVENWSDQSLKDFIESLSVTIMGIGGGSAGPLWGTMIEGLALPLDENIMVIDSALLKKMLCSSLEEIQSITTAKVGDKTMMDTLIPAVQAARETDGSIIQVLEAAATAAVSGAKETEKFVSKFGRAKSYKEQTIGTPDAGALSLSIFFIGLAAGAKQ